MLEFLLRCILQLPRHALERNCNHPYKGKLSVIGGILIVCACLLTPILRAQTAPDLPRLLFESFGPGIREQAQKAYTAARARPRDAEAAGRLGMILQTYEQYEYAAACYERARRLAPTEFQWAYYLSTVQAALGKHTEAAATLREAARLRPDYLPAQVRLADALFAAGELRESRQLYEAIVSKRSDIAQAHYGLGRVKSAEREVAAAIGHYRRACELYPGYGAAHYALGLAYRDAGQTAKAAEHFSLYQKHKLDRPPLADPLMSAVAELNAGAAEHVRRGVESEKAGNLERSVAEHERALAINPQLAQAHINLITLYGRLNRVEQAEKHYRAAVALNPDIAESHYNFGVLMTEQGQYEEAARAFQRSLESNPYYAEAHLNYGVLLERQGRLDDAVARYRAAIENKPNFRLAHFHLGRVLVHKGQLAEAIHHFHQTLAPEDESTPRFMYALAAAYVRAGDRRNALQYARGARQRAAALGQTELLALIERDLRTLEQNQ